MSDKLRFLEKIRNRFVLSFVLIVILLTGVIVSMLASSYKDLVDRFAKDSLSSLSTSVFETLYVSMNYGDNDVVYKVLQDLKDKNLVDKLEIYRNIKIDELFGHNPYELPLPLEVGGIFLTKKESYFEIKTDDFQGVRYLKPIIAKQECMLCHTNMIEGDALGVVDLTLSLEKQVKQSEYLITKIVTSILVLVAISGVILHFVSNSLIFNPIRDLQDATKRLAEADDLDVKVNVKGKSEFSEIAQHFNIFISKVKLMHYKIEHLLANSEAIVKEKTKELERYIEIVDEHIITSRSDPKGNITYASKAFSDVSGYTKEELMGKPHNIVRHPDMPKEVFKELWKTIKSGKSWSGEIKNLKKNGGYYWVEANITPIFDDNGNIVEYMAVRHDVTVLKELESTLDKLTEVTIKSHTDTLTGIYNRSKLNETLDAEIRRAERYGSSFSVAIMDVDHFKAINDNYGHLEGDEVLKGMAKILANKTRKNDVVGRWGGEEFVMIFTDSSAEQTANRCDKIRHWIELHNFGTVPRVTASFGVSEYVKGDTIESLIARADKALYNAKEGGRNRVEIEKESEA